MMRVTAFEAKSASGRHAASAASYEKQSYRALRALAAMGALAALAGLSACQGTATPPAAAATAQPARTAIDWAALQSAVGSYDAQAHFLRAPGLDARLRTLLGTRYALVMRNLEVAGPLQVERGIYYVTGNRAHMGGIEAAAIALQPASDSVRVWLLHEGREEVIEEGRNAFAWPTDVQTTIRNNAGR